MHIRKGSQIKAERGNDQTKQANVFQKSGTKKEHKPKLLSPDIFRWGRGLSHEGVGAKKFCMPLETREIKLFRAGYLGDFAGISRNCPKSLRKKFVFNLVNLLPIKLVRTSGFSSVFSATAVFLALSSKM